MVNKSGVMLVPSMDHKMRQRIKAAKGSWTEEGRDV